MAAVPQQRKAADFWQALSDLEFVTAFFTWLFRLMSRLAEPLMTLAAIYIIIEAGVPLVSVPVPHWLSVALLISAPEIILPGGFILAGELHGQHNRHWWMLFGMCWLFVILTAVTLADLFVLHWTGTLFQVLMWARCAAAFGYSILFRVITHRSFAVDVPSPLTLPPDFSGQLQDIQVTLTGLSREMRASKAIAHVTEKRPNCEQVRWSESPLVWEPQNFGFMEYGQSQKEAQNGTLLPFVRAVQSAQKPESKTEERDAVFPAQKLEALLATGRRTATIKEVVEVTGYTEKWIRNRLAKKVLKRCPRNADLILVDSLVTWYQSERKARGETVPKDEQELPVNG